MRNEEILSVPVYRQHCTLAGKRCWDEEMIESDSDDIHILKDTREELLALADAYENGPNNSNGLYWRKVAKTIREELE